MADRLSGRRILVVGAGTQRSDDPDAPIGNGRAISVLAAREGAAVACADKDRDAADETARLVESAGGTASVVVGDVVDEVACARIVDEAAGALGGLDGLVCNVGIGVGRGLAETTVAEWDAVFAVNTRAHFLLCRAALPLMTTGGAIVFLSSVAGLRPGTRIPAYDTSKAALGRTVPARRARRLPPGRAGERRRTRVDRHAARPPRDAGPSEPRPHAGAARAPGAARGRSRPRSCSC